MNSTAATLVWRRRLLELSQARVAELAGSTQATLSNLERGARDVRLSTLVEIVRALGMDLRVVPNELLPVIDDLIESVRSGGVDSGTGSGRPLYRLDDETVDVE
ncbi:MAG: helix-turn-helix transcriptional regulator [Gemmatimonadales bacterium]|jgi:transcriptional regulator with XRE-family HTH domain|nr:helix-turn-helix transcriptional regulator [Gemmatimonadales bacterium]